MQDTAFTARLVRLRGHISPLARGALFYTLFWGYAGIAEPFLNAYFVEQGLTGTQIGAINALFPAMMVLVTPFVAGLADRKARRAALFAACCCALSAAYFALGLPTAFAGLFLGALFLAIFRSPTVALADAVTIRHSIRYNVDYGKMRLWGSLSFAAVTIIMGYVWARTDMNRMFAVTAACVLVVAASIKLMEEDPPVARQAHSPWRLLLRDRELLVLFIATLLVGGALHINFTFGPVYVLHLGGDASTVGLLIGISAACEIPMMFVGGALMRRMGGLRSLLLAYALFIAGYVLGLVAWAPWVLLAAAVPTGMGFGLFFIATVLTFDRRAPDHWSASIQAMVSVGAFGLAPIVASFAGGLIYDAWPAGTYAVSAGMALVAAAALILLLSGWGRQYDSA